MAMCVADQQPISRNLFREGEAPIDIQGRLRRDQCAGRVSGGKPGGSTDILVTDAYRWAFERGEQYGMAAALGTIIFLLLLGWTLIGRGLTKGDEEARP